MVPVKGLWTNQPANQFTIRPSIDGYNWLTKKPTKQTVTQPHKYKRTKQTVNSQPDNYHIHAAESPKSETIARKYQINTYCQPANQLRSTSQLFPEPDKGVMDSDTQPSTNKTDRGNQPVSHCQPIKEPQPASQPTRRPLDCVYKTETTTLKAFN